MRIPLNLKVVQSKSYIKVGCVCVNILYIYTYTLCITRINYILKY